MIRFFSIPWIVSVLYKNLIWKIPATKKVIYLTFDDGPVPETTEWILNELSKFNVGATFFCVGENVQKYPNLVTLIKEKGHSLGNHTFNHKNGKKTSTHQYLANIRKCAEVIDSRLFRPPYGKLTLQQTRGILRNNFKIIMWSLLSYDFDQTVNPEKIFRRITRRTRPGKIVVFHDNIKALSNLKAILPRYLDYCTQEGYKFMPL